MELRTLQAFLAVTKEENITNRMRYIVDTLNKAAKVYYQTGEELMPNFEYDKLERELEANPQLKQNPYYEEANSSSTR